jgi:ribose transport system permease protein
MPLEGRWQAMLKKLKKFNISGVAIGDIVLFIVFSICANNFLSAYNIALILRNCCTLLIASIGMTLVILISQIDMSIGSVASLAAILAALLVNKGCPTIFVFLIPLLMGAAVGAINGVLIAKMKFDFWVVTFGTMSVVAGIALGAVDGNTMPLKNSVMDAIGNGRFLGIHVMVWLTVIIVAIMIFVEKKTKFGHNIFSIGGSESVAALSGVKVVKNRIIVYILSGSFAALSGLAIACMTQSGSPSVGTDYSFNAMAAVVIGGTSFDGGKGGLTNTVYGVLLMKILASGLSMMGIPATWQKAITGVIIVSLIVADVLNDHRKSKNALRRVYQNV